MIEISGTVAPGFERAREAFAANFAREGAYREAGASFAAFHKGQPVVHLWGGYRDAARTIPWAADTLVNVWSSTKGVTATALALLVDRGLINYADLVVRHWPEFGENGKDKITVAQLMSHQAGLPGFAEPTTADDLLDWEGCTAKLARQKPVWEPGTASSYHALTYGWLAGELIRRVAKKQISEFVRDEIAKPLSADIHIGLPEALEPRVAPLLAPVDPAPLPPLPDVAMMALINPQLVPTMANWRAWRAAEIPAANGQANAMGLARLYNALANGDLLARRTVTRMTAPATSDGRRDMFLGFTDSWGMGVALNTPGIYGPNKRAFGHSGWGGSFGCADPDAGVAIGYVCSQMGPELVGDPRTAGLCGAVFAALA